MESFIKTINEYKKWKSSIHEIIDENFDKIAELIIDAYGENLLIPIKKKQISNFSGYYEVIDYGVVINRHQINSDLYIWFYYKNSFYLIERNKSNALNLIPNYFTNDPMFPVVKNNNCFRARFEDEVEFVMVLLDWSEDIIDVLKTRMDKIDPKRSQDKLHRLTSITT